MLEKGECERDYQIDGKELSVAFDWVFDRLF